MSWVRRWFGRRRPSLPEPPPCPDQSRLLQAAREARRAEEVLDQVTRHDRQVDEVAERAERVRRRNHLGPSFWAWAEHLGDGRGP